MTNDNCEIDFLENKIIFSGVITSFKFYEQIFYALKKHYKKNGNKAIPVFSFNKVLRFEPKVIPNIIGIGLILKQFHQTRIPLEITNSEAIGFLYFINFFRIVGTKQEVTENLIINQKEYFNEYVTGLEIFTFDDRYLGFFGNKHQLPEYRKEHKAHIYYNNSYEYYKLYLDNQQDKKTLEKKLEEKRTQTFEDFELNKIPKDFGKVLSDYVTEESFYSSLIKVLSELATNSVLYSYSPCITMLHTNKFATTIAMSDFGIGLEGSIKYKPDFVNKITNHFKKEGLYKDSLKEFLLIMDCFQYSKEKERENLWSLKERIKKYQGTLRIHYNTTQVVFGSRCNGCNNNVMDCAQCLINSAKEDYDKSTLRIYQNKLSGFHVEIEIVNPEIIQKNQPEL